MIRDAECGSGNRAALTRCIAVAPTVFAAEYWGRKPLLSRASELGGAGEVGGCEFGGDFSDLFSLAAVDELVANRALRTPFVRMANEGSLLAPSRYTSGSGFGAEVPDQLDSDRVLAEFAAGATLVLQGLHRTWEPLREFTRTLVEELGHPVQVNAYVTPASSRGFDPHYDVHDVFVIQIHGEKHWRIHSPVHEDPLHDQPWSDHADAVARHAADAPAIDAVFAPGDVLYLPRGWIHSATALGGTSIHLTIGVAALTRWDIVERLVARLAEDPALRTALPIGVTADAAGFEAILSQTVDAVREGLSAAANAEPIRERLTATLRASTRPEPLLPISTVEALSALSPTSLVRWRSGLGARIESNAETVDILHGRARISLPAEAEPAIRSLSTGVPTAAGSLSGLDENSSLVVARRLVREGILVLP